MNQIDLGQMGKEDAWVFTCDKMLASQADGNNGPICEELRQLDEKELQIIQTENARFIELDKLEPWYKSTKLNYFFYLLIPSSFALLAAFPTPTAYPWSPPPRNPLVTRVAHNLGMTCLCTSFFGPILIDSWKRVVSILHWNPAEEEKLELIRARRARLEEKVQEIEEIKTRGLSRKDLEQVEAALQYFQKTLEEGTEEKLFNDRFPMSPTPIPGSSAPVPVALRNFG